MNTPEYGTTVVLNQRNETCGGDQPLELCATTKELSRLAMTIDTNYPSSMTDSWRSNGNTSMQCQDCGMVCGVAVHFVNGQPSEELCFTFTDEAEREATTQNFEEIRDFEE